LLNGVYFRVWAAIIPVKTFGKDFSLANDHSANHRVWCYPAFSQLCELKAPSHVGNVFFHFAKKEFLFQVSNSRAWKIQEEASRFLLFSKYI
jgi:hypothetical protein